MRNFFIWFFFCFLIIPYQLRAQEPRNQYQAYTSVYAELGGIGGVTANLDYITMETGSFKTSIRLGAGGHPIRNNGKNTIIPIVPLELLGFFGQEKYNFETGLGYTHRFTSISDEPNYYISSRLGLRYQKPRGGLLFRIGYIPLFYKDVTGNRKSYVISPAFALSLGTSF
jgi:hypothetical protein